MNKKYFVYSKWRRVGRDWNEHSYISDIHPLKDIVPFAEDEENPASSEEHVVMFFKELSPQEIKSIGKEQINKWSE